MGSVVGVSAGSAAVVWAGKVALGSSADMEAVQNYFVAVCTAAEDVL